MIFPSQPVYWLCRSHFSDWGKQNNICQLSAGCPAVVCAHVFCSPSCTAPRCRRYKLLPHSSFPVFFPVEVHSIEFTSHSFLQYNLYCRILLHVHANPLNLISPPRNRKKLGGVSPSNQAAKWSFSRQFYQFIFKYSPGYLFSFSTCNKKCPLFFFFFTSFLSYTLKFKVAVSL